MVVFASFGGQIKFGGLFSIGVKIGHPCGSFTAIIYLTRLRHLTYPGSSA
jgi:hypothetical protein